MFSVVRYIQIAACLFSGIAARTILLPGIFCKKLWGKLSTLNQALQVHSLYTVNDRMHTCSGSHLYLCVQSQWEDNPIFPSLDGGGVADPGRQSSPITCTISKTSMVGFLVLVEISLLAQHYWFGNSTLLFHRFPYRLDSVPPRRCG